MTRQNRLRGRFRSGCRICQVLIAPVIAAASCTGSDVLFGPLSQLPPPSAGSVDLGIAVVQPGRAVTVSPGIEAVIQWVDIATVPGTVVRVAAQRQNAILENVGDPIQLVGDGTPGSGRDALADGDADIFIWDFTGVRVGDYVITVTIETPDGQTLTAVSRDEVRGTTGVLTIKTALPVPTLAFTAPGAADETFNAGGTFDITWTDNGDANPDAALTLALDADNDHESGNEIVLLRDWLLSTDGAAGTFTFIGLDENGDTVPDDTYTVLATVDDRANDPITVEATGKLIVAP